MVYTGALMNIRMEQELSEACKNGSLETVERILGKTRGHYPQALAQAVEYERHHIVRFLLELGTSPSTDTLKMACDNKDQAVLKLLMKHGGKRFLKSEVIEKAAYSGDPDVFQTLIEHNCPVTSVAIENAIEGGNGDLVARLLELKVNGVGIKPDAKTFACALIYNDLNAIHLLTKHSKDIVEDWAGGVVKARKTKAINASLLAVKAFLTARDFEKLQNRIQFILPNAKFFLNEEEEAA